MTSLRYAQLEETSRHWEEHAAPPKFCSPGACQTVWVSLSIQNVEVGLANLAAHPVRLGGKPRQGIGVLHPPRPALARAGAALAHGEHTAVTLKQVNKSVSRRVEGGGILTEALLERAANDCAADVKSDTEAKHYLLGQPVATATHPWLRPALAGSANGQPHQTC